VVAVGNTQVGMCRAGGGWEAAVNQTGGGCRAYTGDQRMGMEERMARKSSLAQAFDLPQRTGCAHMYLPPAPPGFCCLASRTGCLPARRDVYLLLKPRQHISDFFVKTPLKFDAESGELAAARSAWSCTGRCVGAARVMGGHRYATGGCCQHTALLFCAVC